MSVYANPANPMKEMPWNELFETIQGMTEPWLLAGGLNDVREPADKKGGAPFNWFKALVFNERINKCQLLELDSIGGKFTWKGPSNQGYEHLFERLDRALCNLNWRLLFTEAYTTTLIKAFLDHHPVAIIIRGN